MKWGDWVPSCENETRHKGSEATCHSWRQFSKDRGASCVSVYSNPDGSRGSRQAPWKFCLVAGYKHTHTLTHLLTHTHSHPLITHSHTHEGETVTCVCSVTGEEGGRVRPSEAQSPIARRLIHDVTDSLAPAWTQRMVRILKETPGAGQGPAKRALSLVCFQMNSFSESWPHQGI